MEEKVNFVPEISVGNEFIEELDKAIKIVIECFKFGGKVLVCGNGGSAADAQHMAAEMMVKYKKERKGLPCIALTTDTSILTAWSNDHEFDTLFERQVETLGKKGDVLIGISTSGNSQNVINAIYKAKEISMRVIALLGNGGGKMKGKADIDIIIPSSDTPIIQVGHITAIHKICDTVEKWFVESE